MALRGNELLVWVPPDRGPEALRGLTAADLTTKNAAMYDLYFDTSPFPKMLFDWHRAGCTFVAHNAEGFDAQAWHELVEKRYFPAEYHGTKWYDTRLPAKAGGFPGDLERLGAVFAGRGKHEGKAALRILYTARVDRSGGVVYNVGTVPLWKSVLQYNIEDVLLLEKVYNGVRQYAEHEPDVMAAHSEINQRGIAVDRDFLVAFSRLWRESEAKAGDELRRITDGRLTIDDTRSPKRVKDYLASECGLTLDTLRRDELEKLYADPEEYLETDDYDSHKLQHAIEVLKLRQAANRTGKNKLDRMAELTEVDGRVRNLLNYYGAHTGRWSGRGLQPHNFSRGRSEINVESVFAAHADGSLTLSTLESEAARVGCSLDDVLSTLVRAVFRASDGNQLVIVDYASVEARGVAWISGESALLSVFADPGADVYCDMATRLYGRTVTKKDKEQRQVGKIIVLGCGYGMGAPKFAITAGKLGVNLAKAGVTAEQCVTAYRQSYPNIAGRNGVWRNCQRAAFSALDGAPVVAGKCRFAASGGVLTIELPSGRKLYYRNCRVEQRVPGYCKVLGLPEETRPTIVYDHSHGYERQLYGGLLVENIVQAICRDLLAGTLSRLHAGDIPVVMHVHDEVVAEVNALDSGDLLRRVCEVMSSPPAWADGFPVVVEGFTNERYTKAPFRGGHKCEAMNGSCR